MIDIDQNTIDLITKNNKNIDHSSAIDKFLEEQENWESSLSEEEREDVKKFGYNYIMGL